MAAKTAAKKAAPRAAKPTRAKSAPGQCHHRNAAGQPDCKKPITAKAANLCGDSKTGHQGAWVTAARERAAAKPKVAKAPKSAGTSAKAAGAKTRRVAKNSGGEKRTAKPPVHEMHVAAIPRAVTNAPEQSALVQLVAAE